MNVCHILYIFRPIRVTFGITDVHNRSLYDCVFCENIYIYIYIYRQSEIHLQGVPENFARIYCISCPIWIKFGMRNVLVNLQKQLQFRDNRPK